MENSLKRTMHVNETPYSKTGNKKCWKNLNNFHGGKTKSENGSTDQTWENNLHLKLH